MDTDASVGAAPDLTRTGEDDGQLLRMETAEPVKHTVDLLIREVVTEVASRLSAILEIVGPLPA